MQQKDLSVQIKNLEVLKLRKIYADVRIEFIDNPSFPTGQISGFIHSTDSEVLNNCKFTNSAQQAKLEFLHITSKIRIQGILFNRGNTKINFQVPLHTKLDLEIISGSVTLVGSANDVKLEIGNGSITADDIHYLKAEIGNGKMQISHLNNGKFDIGRANIDLQKLSGQLKINHGLGNFNAQLTDSADLNIDCGKGNINLVIPRQVPVWQSIDIGFGHLNCDLEKIGPPKPEQKHIRLKLSCGWGNVNLSHPNTSQSLIPK